ncbi:MAG: polysaccharide deacetylase family protein [Acidobacteriia bacterium]|nr:polysaccharide deacetylase family protein [Terriglobia bacterium]
MSLKLFLFGASLALLALPAFGQFRWPEGKTAAVSLSFDDARASQAEVGAPLLEKYGAKATFFVNPRAVKDRLDAWKKVLAAGQEIGNHTTSHPCTVNYPFSSRNPLEDYTIPRIEEEMDGANAEIEHLLGVKPVTFAYPCGQKFVGRGVDLKSYVPAAAKRFLACRGFLDEGSNDPARCDLAQTLGMVSDGLTFEQMRSLAAAAAKQGGWLVFAGHEIGKPGPQATEAAVLEQFLRYARDPANGVWLDTVQAVAKYIQAQRGGGLH